LTHLTEMITAIWQLFLVLYSLDFGREKPFTLISYLFYFENLANTQVQSGRRYLVTTSCSPFCKKEMLVSLNYLFLTYYANH